MTNRLDLAVIESRWWTEGNDSVRGLFDALAGIHWGNPFAYHYEMFNNAASLKEMIPRIAKQKDVHNLYIAAHGDAKAIYGAGEQKISRAQLWGALASVGPRQLYGLYLGSCSTGESTENIIRRTNFTWVAGYAEEVGWIDSAAMDLCFWNAYYNSSVPKEGRKENRAAAMLMLVACLFVRFPYMFVELGFQATLSHKKGQYVTVSRDVLDDIGDELLTEAQDFVESHPGCWP